MDGQDGLAKKNWGFSGEIFVKNYRISGLRRSKMAVREIQSPPPLRYIFSEALHASCEAQTWNMGNNDNNITEH